MIEELHIQNFRCFEDITISSLGQVNLIVGKNNIGKTSLLEALYVYANGGSMWSIHNILNQRQESPNLPPRSRSLIDDSSRLMEDDIYASLKNIFNKRNESIEQECKIKSTQKNNDSEITISIIKTMDLERESNSRITDQISPRVSRDLTGDGFLIIQNENWDYVTPFSTSRCIESTKLPPLRIIETCKSYNYNESVFADLWSNLDEREKSININNSLKIMDSRILRAFYTTKREAKVRLDGYKEAQKMTSLGEGVTRIFQLFILAYSAEGGILTIDEFENGLHYSVQEDVFKELFRVTKKLGVQVFITTHSSDTIRAFSKVSNEDNEIDVRLIGLARSEKKSTRGRIFSITYEEHEMKSFIEMGMEVR